MTKMRVHELAKELGVDNKDLMEALKKKDVEVKSHMSSLEDNVVADLKKEFGKSAGAEKAGEKKEEAPKKKTIMQVFRPQNAKNSGRGSSNRPAGARQGAGRGGVRPTGAAGNSARPAAASAGNGARPAGASAGNTARPAGTAAQTARPARPQEKAEQTNSSQAAGENRGQNAARSQENRSQGNRPQGSGNPRRGGERGNDRGGDRYNDRNTDRNHDRNNDRNNDRGGEGRRNQGGNRYQNDGQGRRDGNRYQNDGQGRRSQDGERGSRQPRGDRGNSQYGGNRPQGRQGGRRDERDSIPTPMVEQQKSQRNKGKDKEKDYKKMCIRDRSSFGRRR